MALLMLAAFAMPAVMSLSAATGDREALQAKLSAAKPGDVITLEARTYEAGDLTVPDGVSVRGAGFAKTALDAKGFKNGLLISGGSKAVLADFSVQNAGENGIAVKAAVQPTLSRLRLSSNLTGLLLESVDGGRVENVIINNNRTGAIIATSKSTSLVNASFVGNSAIALSISGNTNVAVFNNLFVNSPTGVMVSANNQNLRLDHNLYFASFIGKLEGEVSRTSLPGWQRLTGFDAHSVTMPVDFADAAKEDFRPVSTLPWSPDLATTSGWGAVKLGDFVAPAEDIVGQKRNANTDLGVFEVTIPQTRKPDGTFTISSADGVKSAALYNANNIQVAALFQNMPLPVGKHNFWVPTRDSWNRPLPTGDYEVRVVESQLTNPYLGLAGTFNPTGKLADSRSWPEEMFAFDAQDRLYILQNAFENGMGIRAFDAEYENHRWILPGGIGNVGAAVDATSLYYLQKKPVAGAGYDLRKINLETGVLEPIAPNTSNRIFDNLFSGEAYGMTLAGSRLFVSDPVQGKIYFGEAADPKFTESFAVPGAKSVTADTKTGVLWAIGADDKVLALDPLTGAIKATVTPMPGITRISANNGRLAVLSPKTGKVQIYDASDPANLKLVQEIGSGDGPFGPQKPERFWFQQSNLPASKMHVALNSRGEVAVVDDIRVSFWSADGKLKKQGLGFWGQHNLLGRFAGDTDVRIWGIDGRYNIKMNSKDKNWQPDTRWDLPLYEYEGRSPRNFFSTGGKNFGVYGVIVGDPGKTADGKLQVKGPIIPEQRTMGLLVVRLDEKAAVPVSLYYADSKRATLVGQHDDSKDGMIDANDTAIELRNPDGSMIGIPWDRYQGNPWGFTGDLIFTSPAGNGSTAQIIPMTGMDPTGMYPVYGWVDRKIVPCTFDGTTSVMPSPYDYKTMEELNRTVQIAPMKDGGYASAVALKSSGGTGLANGAGTDIAGFNKEGLFRWLFRFNSVQGTQGVQSVPEHNLIMGMTTTQCDYVVMDNDGLGLGVLSMPKESHWHGMWSDHAQQQQAWMGNDGQPYYILGDYAANGFHWFAITGMEKTKRQTVPVKIADAEAAEFASSPDLKPIKTVELPKPQVKIRRLDKPFVMDGNLQKWRDAGIAPTAIITPETGTANIAGPKDCSAIVRLAYHGTSLFVQTIVFDDVVTMHQSIDKLYLQDGIEMGLNGFMQGFKFNVSVARDKGPVVYRNKFVVATADRIFTPEQAPRTIKVLDNAKDVEERQFVEAIYGVDLSDSKVIVTEFEVPLTPELALQGEDPKLLETVGPGGSFWIGFLINDNDQPGSDLQKLLTWPATYGTFNVKEAGALATFE